MRVTKACNSGIPLILTPALLVSFMSLSLYSRRKTPKQSEWARPHCRSESFEENGNCSTLPRIELRAQADKPNHYADNTVSVPTENN